MKRILFLSLFLWASVVYSQVDTAKIATTQKFDEVITYVNQLYLDDVNDEELTDAAIVALLEKLDPHSTCLLYTSPSPRD